MSGHPQLTPEQQREAIAVMSADILEAARRVRWDTRQPFPEGANDWHLWLTADEWVAAFSLAYTWTVLGRGDGTKLSLELPIGERMRAVVHTLQEEHGYEWEGVRMDADTVLWPKAAEPLCTDNAVWLVMMNVYRKHPDLTLLLPATVEWCERFVPALDLTPVREFQFKIDNDLAKVGEQMEQSPTWREAFEDLRSRVKRGTVH